MNFVTCSAAKVPSGGCGAASDLPSAFVAMRQGGASGATGKGGSPMPTIVFHGDRDITVHPNNGNWIFERSAEVANSTTKCFTDECPTAMPTPAPSLSTAAGRGSLNIGTFVAPDTRGRVATPPAPTPIPGAGRYEANAALLPRAFAQRVVGFHGARRI